MPEGNKGSYSRATYPHPAAQGALGHGTSGRGTKHAVSATVGMVGDPPAWPWSPLTLLLPELVLAHEDRGHQLPNRWLNGDVEVARVGAGDTSG